MMHTFRDPVCGADVLPQDASARSEHNGTIYYFCCPGCKKSFDSNPEQYLGQAASAHTHACC